MIATREPGPPLPAAGGRQAEPLPPELRFRDDGHACAVVMTFNGTQYRAVLDLAKGGTVKPLQVAKMLEELAQAIRDEVK